MRHNIRLCTFLTTLVVSVHCNNTIAQPVPDLSAPGSLPQTSPHPGEAHVALGRKLFFDPRLSGDATISCATCHNPKHGWADGLELSKGYPGSKYFRNTPTVVNASLGRLMYWDGRLPATDLPTVVRDHISEAHFLQADGRLVIERLRQVPAYEAEFRSAFGGEPTYGRILNAVAAFVTSLTSEDVPFDTFVKGDESAISDSARAGYDLFQGKAGCINCHSGPMFSDGSFHSLGLESNRDIFLDPQRHITFRRFFRTLGVPGYERLRQDPGLYSISKQPTDSELIRTPTLRELASTAPYMHDGQLSTLKAVVAFYNDAGGPRDTKDKLLKPLGLSDEEQASLVDFLVTLSGTLPDGTPPELPAYALRSLGGE